MQGNNKQNEDKSTELSNAKHEGTPTVFSPEETRTIVKEFLKAYIGGQIVINFQDANELIAEAKLKKTTMNFKTAQETEIGRKEAFADEMEICLGTKTASEVEKQEAITYMVRLILGARSGQRIKGEFLTFNVEKMLKELRQDLDETNRLVAEIMVFIRSFRQ